MSSSLQISPAVISFDIDGALVDVWAVIDAALEQVCLELECISGAPVSLEALKALREQVAQDVRFAGASAVDIRVESFRRALALAGLEPSLYLERVTEVFFAEQLGCKKPSPAFFEEAARRCGQPAERICHVGDSLLEDYRPARASGMMAVLVQRSPEPAPEGVLAVAALTELLPVVCKSSS
ncbi:MAG: HAD family hydrolase [Chloroflexota bacterium]